MSKLLTRSIMITFCLLFGLAIASHAPLLALELEYPQWLPLKQGMGLAELVFVLFEVFLVVAGTTAFLMLVVGGVRYLTAFGQPAKLTDAKNQVLQALIGLVLLLSCFLILSYLNPQLPELREPTAPPLKPVVVARPDKIAVRVVLNSPEEKEFEYSFSKDIAETVEVATLNSRKLLLSFSPTTKTLSLCLEGSVALVKPAVLSFIAGYDALAQVSEPVWSQDPIISGSEEFKWLEPSPPVSGEQIVIKGMITIAVGLDSPPLPTFGSLDYVPLGKNMEITVNFLNTEVEGRDVLSWLEQFYDLASQRHRDKCGGGKCNYTYTECLETCHPSGSCCEYECTSPCPFDNCCLRGSSGKCLKKCTLCDGTTSCCDDCICKVPCVDECCADSWKEEKGSCGPGDAPGTCKPPDRDQNRTPCLEKEEDINRKISELELAKANLDDPKLKTVLQKGLVEVVNCLSQEGHLLLSCEDAVIWFEEEGGGYRLVKDIAGQNLWPCDLGKDFICTWAEGEDEYAQKIVFPIEYLKRAYEAVGELDQALWDRAAGVEYCQCKKMHYSCKPSITASLFKDFTCEVAPSNCKCFENGEKKPCPSSPGYKQREDCANTCKVPLGDENQEAPFPEGFSEARDQAWELACEVGLDGFFVDCAYDWTTLGVEPAITSLKTAYEVLDKNLKDISSWGALEQLDTCYEVKSLLKSYLETGNIADCPPTEIYPCCPPQKLTDPVKGFYFDLTETVRNCSDSDFFFCNPPSTTLPPDVVVPPGGNCSSTGKDCSSSLPNPICGPYNPGDEHPGSNCYRTAVNKFDSQIKAGIEKSAKKYQSICGGHIDPVKMLKAIMANESSGELGAKTSPKDCKGLFQLNRENFDKFKAACGASTADFDDDGWFGRKENVDEQACIALEYLQELDNTDCRCDVRQLAAGYNGGPKACELSKVCADCQMCLNQNTRDWECLWDWAPAPPVKGCNTGYTETRKYAPRVEYCYGIF